MNSGLFWSGWKLVCIFSFEPRISPYSCWSW